MAYFYLSELPRWSIACTENLRMRRLGILKACCKRSIHCLSWYYLYTTQNNIEQLSCIFQCVTILHKTKNFTQSCYICYRHPNNFADNWFADFLPNDSIWVFGWTISIKKEGSINIHKFTRLNLLFFIRFEAFGI